MAFTYVRVDGSRAVLEHHRSFIPSTLVNQLKENKKLRLPTATQVYWAIPFNKHTPPSKMLTIT